MIVNAISEGKDRGLFLKHPKLVLLLLIEDRCENTRHQLGSSFLALLRPSDCSDPSVPPLSLPNCYCLCGLIKFKSDHFIPLLEMFQFWMKSKLCTLARPS